MCCQQKNDSLHSVKPKLCLCFSVFMLPSFSWEFHPAEQSDRLVHSSIFLHISCPITVVFSHQITEHMECQPSAQTWLHHASAALTIDKTMVMSPMPTGWLTHLSTVSEGCMRRTSSSHGAWKRWEITGNKQKMTKPVSQKLHADWLMLLLLSSHCNKAYYTLDLSLGWVL